jgi:hypothetical protein
LGFVCFAIQHLGYSNHESPVAFIAAAGQSRVNAAWAVAGCDCAAETDDAVSRHSPNSSRSAHRRVPKCRAVVRAVPRLSNALLPA